MREREADRQTDRARETETDRDREAETERQRETETERLVAVKEEGMRVAEGEGRRYVGADDKLLFRANRLGQVKGSAVRRSSSRPLIDVGGCKPGTL